jgi:tRNA pseudouridine38-40 synthase
VRLIAAARTDSGVHAEHQVAIFRTEVAPDERRWLKGLYGLLPASVGVTKLAACDPEFHPIVAATGKVYCYRIWLGAARNPFLVPFVWTMHRELDAAAMQRAARDLVGRHDFTSFCALDSSAKTRERTVTDVRIEARGPLIEVWVAGEGFLKQMVRNIVGTLVDVGAGKTAVDAVPGILAAKDRGAAGACAPAEGLTLVRIFYGEPPRIDAARTDGARVDFAIA